MLQKLEEERRLKKECVEEFKFKKEMDRARERQLQDMEKRKAAGGVTQEQKDRIFKREEEVFRKKHEMIVGKQAEKEEQERRREELKERMGK